MSSPSRSELRALMRARRRGLGAGERRRHARRLAWWLARHPLFHHGLHIACYLAQDGEMELAPLMRRIWAAGKLCYLPVLDRRHPDRMHFALYRQGDLLRRNRFGIPEPVVPRRALVSARDLDLVLLPLVAFDASGNRLGMGGGFYDRTFAFLRHAHRHGGPHLVGIAHAVQEVPSLDAREWDVPLEAVATERGVRRNRARATP